jgi:hypothetical protein
MSPRLKLKVSIFVGLAIWFLLEWSNLSGVTSPEELVRQILTIVSLALLPVTISTVATMIGIPLFVDEEKKTSHNPSTDSKFGHGYNGPALDLPGSLVARSRSERLVVHSLFRRSIVTN